MFKKVIKSDMKCNLTFLEIQVEEANLPYLPKLVERCPILPNLNMP